MEDKEHCTTDYFQHFVTFQVSKVDFSSTPLVQHILQIMSNYSFRLKLKFSAPKILRNLRYAGVNLMSYKTTF